MMEDENEEVNFSEMGLDERILEAIARLGWKEPTPIQQKSIPYFLEGKDISAEARTGSGKTGAFVIPIIQKILQSKPNAQEQVTRALILAPSKELCRQITENIQQLTVKCARELRCVDVAEQGQLEAQRPLLLDKPDIVVGTPSRIYAHMNAKFLDLKSTLEYLVVDEADLMFHFDHRDDLENILKKLPNIYQSFFTSATMNQDVKQLKKLVLNNPIRLKLEEPPLPTNQQLTQYAMKIEEFEKALLLYALFRMNMIQGKTLVFVNTVDKSYKLHLFLQQFDISTCVLNSEKPAQSRCHIVELFNKGVHDIIIASDERNLSQSKEDKIKQEANQHSKRKKDKESGVSRGIDFQNVSNIINFDFPHDILSYIHRVGRTARGNNNGIAISLVSHAELDTFYKVKDSLGKVMDSKENVLKDFKFDFCQVDGFRYRAQDAWKRCTKILIMETRKNDIMNEILNSNKLKAHFNDNPQDLAALRNIKKVRGLSSMPHLKNVQDYMLSDDLRKVSTVVKKVKKGNRKVPKRLSSTGQNKYQIKNQKKAMRKKADPLKSMQFTGFTELK